MKRWYDEKYGCHMCEPDCCDEWLSLIWMIGVDYDGCSTVESLEALVDELVEMSQKARDCLHDGKLFPTEEVMTNALQPKAPSEDSTGLSQKP